MPYLILFIVLIALAYWPMYWVRKVMKRYDSPPDRYPSSGAELATHLLNTLGMEHVRVEQTEAGDHYDPLEKVVRLAPERYQGHSLTAVTVAAHEVGHAIQDHQNYAPLKARTRLVQLTRPLERLGAGILMAAPLVGLLTRAPGVAGVMLLGGLLSLGSSTLIHAFTLPTELDASFRRALPVMQEHGVLFEEDHPHARKILRAAAMTYVAASLVSILNIGRWWALLRR